jgi:hypothetical protein
MSAHRQQQSTVVAGAVFLLLLCAPPCWAQASEAEMRAFPMPPIKGWDVVSPMNGGTNQWYGYWMRPLTPRSTTGGGAADDYSYVIFWGQGIVNGRTGVFWDDWRPTYIPPPQGEADGCFHTHVSYGVWGYANVWNPFGANYKQWKFLGGGGMSGMRDANGKCVHHADNPLKNTDPRFGWGDDVTTISLRPPCTFIFCTTYYDYIMLGVLNNTHGTGDCGAFACIEPGVIDGYAVP